MFVYICLIALSTNVLSNAQSSSSSSSLSSSFYSSRSSLPFSSTFDVVLGHRPYQRAECRNPFPSKSDIFPHGVVISGRVDDVRPVEIGGNPLISDPTDGESRYIASVYVRRVIAGPKSLRHQRITVTGFGDSNKSWCHANVRKGESWIFVLAPIGTDFFRITGSLIRVTLSNIEKIDSIVAGETFTKHRQVTELACEKKYCENNANCIPDEYSTDGARCECVSFCKPTYAPVCGSNGETYNNECELRMKSCLMKKNLFVKSTSPCSFSGTVVRHRTHHRGSDRTRTTSPSSGVSSPSTSIHHRSHHRHRPSTDRRTNNRNTVTTTTNTQRTYTRQY